MKGDLQMENSLYALGYTLVRAVPVVIAIVCIAKISKNIAEISKMKEEQKKARQENSEKKS